MWMEALVQIFQIQIIDWCFQVDPFLHQTFDTNHFSLVYYNIGLLHLGVSKFLATAISCRNVF